MHICWEMSHELKNDRVIKSELFQSGKHLKNHPVHFILTSHMQHNLIGQIKLISLGWYILKTPKMILMCIHERELLLIWPNPPFFYKREIEAQYSSMTYSRPHNFYVSVLFSRTCFLMLIEKWNN